MSGYSVNFYGNFEGTADDEQKVVDAIDAFVKTLPGVSGGTINADGLPQVVLQASHGDLGGTIAPTQAAQTTTDAAKLADGVDAEVEDEGASLGAASTEELQAELARRAAAPPA